jgi:hypothetical protein
MKKYIALISLLTVFTLISGCTKAPQPETTQPNDNTTNEVNDAIDTETTQDWQVFELVRTGFTMNFPADWQNAGNFDQPMYVDANGKNKIGITLFGDEPAMDSTGKQVIENIITSAVSNTGDISSVGETEFIKEELSIGNYTAYKVYHPGYLQGLEDYSYYYTLPNNAGFVELYVSKDSNENIIQSILETVEIKDTALMQ